MDYIQALLGLCCFGVIKGFDLEDPAVIFWVRVAFALGSSLTLLALAALYLRIQSADDKQIIVLTKAELSPPQPMAAMLGAPAEPDANKPMQITIREHDLTRLRSVASGAITPLAITLALHLWKGFMPPIILQSVMALAGVLGSELAKIHLFGQSEKTNKDLKRPWKAKSPFAAFADLKKEMRQTMSASDAKPARKNKKAENKMSLGKTK